MTTYDFNSPAQMEAKRLRFDRYVLDLDRGCLLVDGNEITLRPKTFAVLHYLVENSGRLVSKDELFAAVWPNLAVTDDALVQSIGELRRALGDDGPRLIKTIPRRGYRFESDVSVASVGRSSADAASVAASPPAAVRWSKPGARFGLFAAFGLAVLLAGMLWAGIATEWKFFNAPGYANRPTPNSVEIGAKPAIAILPFANQNNDSARDYFADGLTQDIINALGRFSELTVMSWNAVFPYKGKPASPGEIARNLAVRYQVEGSVRQTGDRVRVTAQLVDADGQVLWSARFDEALADLFALQDKITTQIAGALAIRVTQIEQRRVLAKPTESLEAYEYVLRARPALQRPTRANIVEARALLRRAIELDPNYAAAYAALAETYHVAAVDGLGGIAGRHPEPCGGNGQQGAEPRRFRRARAHHSRPHPYLPSAIRAGQGGDRPCDRDQSERCPWPRRPRQYPDVAGSRRMLRSRSWSWRSASIPSSIRSIALRSASPTI